MRFGNLIFGVALLLVASTLALTITFRNGAPEPASASSGRPSGAQPVASDSAQRGAIPHNLSARSQRAGSGSSEVPRPLRQKLPAVEELDLVLADGPSAPPLSPAQRQEISQRTASVKRAAIAKLDKMTERLDLTPAQRHKIYPNLIRSTNGYHEAMVIAYPVGSYPIEVASNDPLKTESKSPDEAIHDALDPDQQDDFVEDKLDERAWWNEIVAQLEEDFDSSVVAAATAPPEEEPKQEDPDPAPTPEAPAEEPAPAGPQQGGNIFDLLNQ